MKKVIYILTTILLISCGDSSTIGMYKKEPLPVNFSYKIIEDNSNNALDKNQLAVEISEKITIEQIATLADEFYSSKPKQRRFYIAYFLSGKENKADVWAVSNFDPELKIDIIGSTEKQDIKTSEASDIKGTILGKWRSDESLMGATLILYTNSESKLKMRINFKDGRELEREINKSSLNGKTCYRDDNKHGEYYILESNGNLGMYGNDGKFDEAVKLN